MAGARAVLGDEPLDGVTAGLLVVPAGRAAARRWARDRPDLGVPALVQRPRARHRDRPAPRASRPDGRLEEPARRHDRSWHQRGQSAHGPPVSTLPSVNGGARLIRSGSRQTPGSDGTRGHPRGRRPRRRHSARPGDSDRYGHDGRPSCLTVSASLIRPRDRAAAGSRPARRIFSADAPHRLRVYLPATAAQGGSS